MYTTRGWVWPPPHRWRPAGGAAAPVIPVTIEPWAAPEDLSAPLAGDLAYMVALSTYHRHIIHMNRVEAQRLHQNAAPDNHDLRVQFMLNDLAEDKMRLVFSGVIRRIARMLRSARFTTWSTWHQQTFSGTWRRLLLRQLLRRRVVVLHPTTVAIVSCST